MNRPHETLPGLLCLAALAAAFCIWSASGNEVNICVTAGCTLFQDATIAGLSLWWFGAGAFAALALAALLGAAWWGSLLAGLALLGDTGLLLLMAITAPCVSCLLAAVLFALLYAGFRQAAFRRRNAKPGSRPGRSVLLLAWGLLFVINVGTAVRTHMDVWAITDNGMEASVRMFFSPSCPSCKEGVTLLSGHVDVAFYPVAEHDADVYKTAHMLRLLHEGSSMAEALEGAQSVPERSGLEAFSPDLLLLRLRMLRNKAHVFLAGSQAVPFLEYQGLPAMLRNQGKSRSERGNSAPPPRPVTPPAPAGSSADLPLDPQIAGQCSGTAPCP